MSDPIVSYDDIAAASEPAAPRGESEHLRRLNAKACALRGDRIFLKPLTRWNEAYKEFPRFVMEYLVHKYVSPDDPVAGQRKIDRILTEHYTESGKRELIKSRVKEKGEDSLLGQLTVRLEQARGQHR